MTTAIRPRQVGVGVRDHGPTGETVARRAEQFDTRCCQPPRSSRSRRERGTAPRRRSDHFRIERVDAARREHDEISAGSFGRAQDRAEVAGIADPVEDDDERRRRSSESIARSSGIATIARGGCGVSVDATRSSTPSASSNTVPAPSMALSEPSGTNCASQVQPAATASATSTGPSTTKRRSS